ncbi:MAG: HypC/HybG/HupF family hydrogenase formation chaperone [Candidatus Portnoybacteria bacterium]|nr:HypC/HybG/HupF family hydrogenase formation chaperone [Candidatus Portnoybacteria bacterium]MDD4983159.1 HypC/HybG/HupF family hydrogenase formation chaperone [Candidatus Portnoybacteria bacterium]
MCLTIPKQVVSAGNNSVRIRAGKKTESVGTILAVKKGDWVLTQNSIIIKKITAKQAKEINNFLK